MTLQEDGSTIPEDLYAEHGASSDVQEFINSILPYTDIAITENENSENIPLRVHNALELPAKFRVGPPLAEAIKAANISIIQEATDREEPVPIMATIGTSKWYDGSNYLANVAGFSELLMFEQLSHLDRRVHPVYPKGVNIILLAEDVTNEWLYGLVKNRDYIRANNERYIASLHTMLRQMNLDSPLPIAVIAEGQLLEELGMSKTEYFALLHENQLSFSTLITVTRQRGDAYLAECRVDAWTDELWKHFVDEDLSQTQIYQRLEHSGWSGGIHPFVQKFYLEQFKKSLGHIPDEEGYLGAYFAGVHTRKQLGFLHQVHGKKALKVAFLRYPKGTDFEKQNALQISQHPLLGHGSSHQHISPWAATTGLSVDDKGHYTFKVVPAKNMTSTPLYTAHASFSGVVFDVPVYKHEDSKTEH